jgi:glycosyltransferase involved in cell wall biosynthesis
LITGPALADPGGVAAFYGATLQELRARVEAATYLEIGGTSHQGRRLGPILDQLRFRRALRAFKPTLVLCNPSLDPRSFVRDGLFVLQAALAGYPVLVFFHGWRDDFAGVIEKRLRWVFHMTFGKSVRLVVLASRFRDCLRRWGVNVPIDLGVTAVADELLLESRSESKPQHSPDSGSVRLLFLARLEREKGILELLVAFAELRRRGHDAVLTVAGEGGARPEVQGFMDAHPHLRPFITLTGDVRGRLKLEILRSHDIYCFPSYSEGMPTSVLEAMMLGLPVVVTNVGALADFFEPGRMGVLVPVQDSGALADALDALIKDPQARIRMQEYNRDFARSRFSAHAAAALLLESCRAAERSRGKPE